jgi:hypothetical protein
VLSSKLVKPRNDGVIGIKQRALICHEGISFSEIVVILLVKIKKRGPIGTGPKRVFLPGIQDLEVGVLKRREIIFKELKKGMVLFWRNEMNPKSPRW